MCFALAGFLDIAFCCRLLADLPVGESVVWGIVGAVGYASAFLLISYAAEHLGVDNDPQVEPDSQDDVDDEDDTGPWWTDLGWKALAAVLTVGSVLVLFVLFAAKSIVVVMVFAALTADPSAAEVLFVIVASGMLQLIAMYYVVMPIAARHGIAV